MRKDPAGSSPPLNGSELINHRRRGRRATIAFAIFLVAFGVRILTWHDTRLEVGKVQTAVVADYQHIADLFREGGVRSFFSSTSALADPNALGHPPGYPIVIAGIYAVFGRSITTLQFFQIAADALAAVILFLIVAELLPLSAGVVAGLLAALSPQFAWNSVLLLPDSISVVPILLAIYLLTRAARNPRLLTFILIGALIGVSCWLRANAMLLTLFLAVAALLMFTQKRWQFAIAIICGTLLIVLPLTIRNAIVFHRFIPLSLGAGQTFLEGIADYDKDARFGVPNTDMGIMKQEAEIYQRPDYYGTLFNPDGVERERARLSRSFAIVRSHPFWFAGVMARRASSMLRLERSRLISLDPPVSHVIAVEGLEPIWTHSIGPITSGNGWSSENRETLTGDESKYGKQFSSGLITIVQNTDYVFEFPIQVRRGRIRISVNNESGIVYASTVVEALEDAPPEKQPQTKVQLPFVSRKSENVQLVFSNEATPGPVFDLWQPRLFQLGPSRLLWTQYPRFVIHAIQRTFLTAVLLPLTIIGLLILILRRHTLTLVIFSVVPIYFFTVQSAVHTEYRYVIAVTYFLFAFAGVAIGFGIDLVVKKLTTLAKS